MKFGLLEIVWTEDDQFWFGVFEIETRENSHHLFYIEYWRKSWKFDFLWLRALIHKIRNRE